MDIAPQGPLPDRSAAARLAMEARLMKGTAIAETSIPRAETHAMSLADIETQLAQLRAWSPNLSLWRPHAGQGPSEEKTG